MVVGVALWGPLGVRSDLGSPDKDYAVTKQISRGVSIQLLALMIILSGLVAMGHGQPVEVPCRARLKGHQGQVDGIVPSADGRLLVTTGWEDGTVRIWDVASGTQRRLFKQEIVGSTIKICDVVSATQWRLIFQEPVETWDRTRGLPYKRKRQHKLQKHASGHRTEFLKIRAALLSDNRCIVMQVFDCSYGDQSSVCPDEIILYDLEGGNHETLATTGRKDLLRPSPDAIYGFTVAQGVGRLAYDLVHPGFSKIFLYDVSKRSIVAQLGDDGLDFGQFWFSPDGEMLSTVAVSDVFTRLQGINSGRLTVWNARTGEKIGRVQTEGRHVLGAWFSPNDRELAILGGADQNTVYICYLGTCKITHTLDDFQRKPGLRRVPMGLLTYAPDGRFLIGMGGNGTVLFWETKHYREVLWARLYQSGGVYAVFSPDGKKMMSIGGGKEECDVVKVWDMEPFLSLMPKVRDGAN